VGTEIDPEEGRDPDEDLAEAGEELAKVIPLGVFDAAEEAKKRW
jgi:hypothetical protein